MTTPRSEHLQLPPEYGNPNEILEWSEVDGALRDAAQYWVASVRPEGRPHVVPRDGIWVDSAWYYGGSDATVHNRNIRSNPSLTMHIGDGMTAVIEKMRPTSGHRPPTLLKGLPTSTTGSTRTMACKQRLSSTSRWELGR